MFGGSKIKKTTYSKLLSSCQLEGAMSTFFFWEANRPRFYQLVRSNSYFPLTWEKSLDESNASFQWKIGSALEIHGLFSFFSMLFLFRPSNFQYSGPNTGRRNCCGLARWMVPQKPQPFNLPRRSLVGDSITGKSQIPTGWWMKGENCGI